MKYINPLLVASALAGLAGCASPKNVTVLPPIGPAPAAVRDRANDGTLVVYSARELAPVDPNQREWRWNDDYGKNVFQYEAAHTGYAIYNPEGLLINRVANSLNPNDTIPTRVSLQPGTYEIRAEAEESGSLAPVKVPVVIQAGRTTSVHLMDGWKPRHSYNNKEVVRLPDGEIAGWLATR